MTLHGNCAVSPDAPRCGVRFEMWIFSVLQPDPTMGYPLDYVRDGIPSITGYADGLSTSSPEAFDYPMVNRWRVVLCGRRAPKKEMTNGSGHRLKEWMLPVLVDILNVERKQFGHGTCNNVPNRIFKLVLSIPSLACETVH